MTSISGCAGHDALHALQKGATLRKKWVSSTSAADAAQVPKTERLIRCRIEGSKVVLHYYHQVCPMLPAVAPAATAGCCCHRQIRTDLCCFDSGRKCVIHVGTDSGSGKLLRRGGFTAACQI